MKINCGDNIKRLRLLNKMSQAELGEHIGVKHGTISSWEINRTEPNIGQIEKLALVFGCKKSDIIENRTIPDYVSGTAELIDLFHKANEEQRKAVLNLLRSFVNQE